MKYLSEKIQTIFLSRSLLHGASHAARYSLCVQLHIPMAIPYVERVGRFKIVTLQNLNVLQPELSPQTVGWQQARRTQQEEITELQVTSKPHVLNITQHLPVEFQSTFHKEVQLLTTDSLQHISLTLQQTTTKIVFHIRTVHLDIHSFIHQYSALEAGLARTRAQSCDRYGSGTLHPGQVLGDSLPLLSPAFRHSHFHRQVPVRPQRCERS